jgi:sugar phosphate isomerase/epimerase
LFLKSSQPKGGICSEQIIPQNQNRLISIMKIGMNMLLWATHVTEEHYPQLEKIKATGFDGVEIPIFGGDDAHYRKLRRKLDDLQLTYEPTRVWRDFFKSPDDVVAEGYKFIRETWNAA